MQHISFYKLLIITIWFGIPQICSANTEFKPIIMEAVNSESGEAQAYLSGPLADLIRARTNKPNMDILVQVTTLQQLPEPGCKRVKIRFTTPGTVLPVSDGSSRMLDMDLKLNICKDGQPPPSKVKH